MQILFNMTYRLDLGTDGRLMDQVISTLVNSKPLSPESNKMPTRGGKGVRGCMTAIHYPHATAKGSDYTATQVFGPEGNEIARVGAQSDVIDAIEKLNHVSTTGNLKHNSYETVSGISQSMLTSGIYLPTISHQILQDWNRDDWITPIRGFAAWKTEVYAAAAQHTGTDQFARGFKAHGMMASNTVSNFEVYKQTIPLVPWSQGLQYDLFEQQFAAHNALPFNVIEEKLHALTLSYNQGMMEWVFLGQPGVINSVTGLPMTGLFNNTDILLNTDVMINSSGTATKLSDMTDADFIAAFKKIAQTYNIQVQNTQYTRGPNRFGMGEDERIALSLQPFSIVSEPGISGYVPSHSVSRLTYIENSLSILYKTNFKVMGNPYLQTVSSGKLSLGYDAYILYRAGEDTVTMIDSIPLTFASIATPDGYNFSQAAFAQFSPVFFRRPQEAVIFQVNN